VNDVIVGAAATLVGAFVGGIATRAGARAQARGQVEATQLQTVSVRNEALWSARQTALVKLVDSLDALRRTTRELNAMGMTFHSSRSTSAAEVATCTAFVEEGSVRAQACATSLAAVKLAVPIAERQLGQSVLDAQADAYLACARLAHAGMQSRYQDMSTLSQVSTNLLAQANVEFERYLEHSRLYIQERPAAAAAAPVRPWYDVRHWRLPWR
jgi:hypothetical protein